MKENIEPIEQAPSLELTAEIPFMYTPLGADDYESQINPSTFPRVLPDTSFAESFLKLKQDSRIAVHAGKTALTTFVKHRISRHS